MKASHRVSAVFDDPNLVSAAGLVPVMRLAEEAGLHELLGEHLSPPSPNPVPKSACVVAGMLTGADSIDDLDVLRDGAMGKVLVGVRAPSTLGTYLRSFTHGHVQQVDAVSSRLLAGLAQRVPTLLAGAEAMAYLDVDDTIRQVHGYAKQGAAYGYSGVRGLNAQLAVVSSPLAAPVIAAARLRQGNTASARGGARLVTQALRTARAAGVGGQLMIRADSAYYQHAFIAAALRAGAWFSVTARMNRQVRCTSSTLCTSTTRKASLMPPAASPVQFDSAAEARKNFKPLLDAAEEGLPASIRRGDRTSAVVDADRLRYALTCLRPANAGLVAEADGWSVFLPGLPIAADGATLDEALDEMVLALREYAEDCSARLRHAPNHADNWALVQIVTLGTDDQVKDWLVGER